MPTMVTPSLPSPSLSPYISPSAATRLSEDTEFTLPCSTNDPGAPIKPKQDISIPRITPFASGETPSSRAHGLVDKFVDEFGNVLNWDGTVLGRVEGDLPSMVGRPVSDTGSVLDASGEVVGYVSENHMQASMKEMGGGLKVDDSGNIYNSDGHVVGKLHGSPSKDGKPQNFQGPETSSGNQAHGCSCQSAKSTAAPSPSEVCLDVKSTHDGIQLIIRIPTMFNKDSGGDQK